MAYLQRITMICVLSCLHKIDCHAALMQLASEGQSQKGDNDAGDASSAPKMLEHLRKGPSGPYMDGFAASPERYCHRSVAHA